jgi:DNA-binding transcriptional ArsR family regulator
MSTNHNDATSSPGGNPQDGEDGVADGADSEEGDDGGSIPLDDQFAILKNRRRRDILKYLREHDGESTLSDLAEFVAAKENDVEISLLSSDERKRVYIGFYQCHLPQMDDAGVVDFEKRSGDVTLRPEAETLFEYIEDPLATDGDDDASDADPADAEDDALAGRAAPEGDADGATPAPDGGVASGTSRTDGGTAAIGDEGGRTSVVGGAVRRAAPQWGLCGAVGLTAAVTGQLAPAGLAGLAGIGLLAAVETVGGLRDPRS